MSVIEKIVKKYISHINANFKISCRYIKDGNILEDYMLKPDIKCHLASVTKFWALIASLYEVQNFNLNLDIKYVVQKEDVIDGQFIIGNLHRDIELTLFDLIKLMIVGYDTFCFDIVFNVFLKERLSYFIKNVLKFNNTDISLSILDLNRKISGIYDLTINKNLKWGNIFDFIENNPDLMDLSESIDQKIININEFNYSTIREMTEFLTKFLKLEILNEKHFSIAEDILLSQYDVSRIPAQVPDYLASSVGHQIGTITDGMSYQIINDCGFIKFDTNNYLILNFFCCDINEKRYVINNAIAVIVRNIINYIEKKYNVKKDDKK